MNPLQAQILECTDQIVIKQHFRITESREPAWDNIYRYQIWDGRTGNQMFNAEEGEIGFFEMLKWILCFSSDRELDLPFVDAMGQEAFKLNKTRSYGLRGCCILGCIAHFNKSCLKMCCCYDNDYSNLSVNRNGQTDYYIHQIQGQIMK